MGGDVGRVGMGEPRVMRGNGEPWEMVGGNGDRAQGGIMGLGGYGG